MNKPNKIYLTGCNHFFHKNIIKFCDRPFSDVEEMNRVLIENWNNTINNEDIVYLLGDVSWGNYIETREILDKLKGKIILIRGNHDQIIDKNSVLQKRFESIHDYKEIYIDSKPIILFHYPIESWNKQFHGSIHLHSHTHGAFAPEEGFILDVGLDGVLCKSKDPKTYRPLEINEIMEYMKTRKQLNKNEK